MKITEAQITEMLIEEGIKFEGYDDDIIIEYRSCSGHDYMIHLTPLAEGVDCSTSKNDLEDCSNRKIVKTVRGLRNYVNKVINR